jgi:hypothetical protein
MVRSWLRIERGLCIHGTRAEGRGVRAVRQTPVINRKLEGAEAQNFPVLVAHGIFLIGAGSRGLARLIASLVRVANWPGFGQRLA